MTVRSARRRLQLGTSSIAVQRWTPHHAAGGPTLVLLHEGLGAITTWRDLPGRLADALGLEVLAYDRPGHGRSSSAATPRPLDYLERAARDELPQVLEAAGVERPLLLGHSDGATIALLYATRQPAAAVVAVAAHVVVEDVTLEGIRRTVERWEEGGLRRGLERHHGSGAEPLFAAWADTWLDPRFRRWNVLGELGGVTCPCLLLQGDADAYATPGHLQLIAQRLAGAVSVGLLPRAGHSPHLEDPEGFLARVTAFVRDLGLTPPAPG